MYRCRCTALRRLRLRDPRPVHLEGGPQPGVARGLPQVLRVSDVSRRKLYLLCQRRKDLLQEGLRQVRRPHLRNGGPSGSGAATRTHTESDSMLEFKPPLMNSCQLRISQFPSNQDYFNPSHFCDYLEFRAIKCCRLAIFESSVWSVSFSSKIVEK